MVSCQASGPFEILRSRASGVVYCMGFRSRRRYYHYSSWFLFNGLCFTGFFVETPSGLLVEYVAEPSHVIR